LLRRNGGRMIISHSRKFIFIKTLKTAGTSLEIVLSRYCGPDDIVTPLIPEEEKQRAAAGGVGARNYGFEPSKSSWTRVLRSRLSGRPVGNRFREHSPAWYVRREIGPEIWDSYFKFGVVRHPVDRCLSRFHYTRDFDLENDKAYWDVNDFDQFLRYRANFINENWPMYTERDQVTLDHMVKYEDLEAGLAAVSERIGLDHNLQDDLSKVHAKGSHRPKSGKSADVVSDRHRMLISTLCEKEIELFGYEV
jgi:Sulfotransferase family